MSLTKSNILYEDDFSFLIQEVTGKKEEANFYLYGHCSEPNCPFEESVGFPRLSDIEDAEAQIEEIFKFDHSPDCDGYLIIGEDPYSDDEMDKRLNSHLN